MKQRFRHAAAERNVATPAVLQVELSDGTTGFGETHARPYVTGETPEGLPRTLSDDFLPALADWRPASFPDALEAVSHLPCRAADGRCINAARAALELALLDAYSRAFRRPLDVLAAWLGEPGLGQPGSLPTIRYSGAVSAELPASVRRAIFKMRLYGLRDFKIKVGDAEDDARLKAAVAALGRSFTAGRSTLRADANGAWNPVDALRHLSAWRNLRLAAVEQPMRPVDDPELPALSASTGIPLMADESLVTYDDARRLIEDRAVAFFNIRLAKNGGLIPSLRMARAAQRAGLHVQLGCLVGETSILSAAGRWFLQLVPQVRFAEGSYGRFLLRDDVVSRSVQFGFGGRAKPMTGLGWGISVEPPRLQRLCAEHPITLAL